MKIKQLEINGFMGIGEAKLSMNDRGLVLIQGDNKEDTSANSNGAGKSSIFDALCWVLYGETARGESGDKVVNRFVKGGCSVCVTIEDDTDKYEIARYRKDKKNKNGLFVEKWDMTKSGDPSVDLTKGKESLTQEVIVQILGCSLEVFRGAVYAGQESFPDLPGMTDKQLKLLVEEAAGVTILEKAYEESRSRLVKAKADVDVIQRNCDMMVAQRVAIEAGIKDVEQSAADWQADQTAKIKIVNEGYVDAVESFDKLSALLKPKTTRLPVIQKSINDAKATIASISSQTETLKDFDARIRAVDLQHAKACHEMAQIQRTAMIGKKKLTEFDDQIGCPCPACARPFSAKDIEPAKKIATKELSDQITLLRNSKEQSEALAESIEKLKSEREAFATTMTDASALYDQIASLHEDKREIEAEIDEWKKSEEKVKWFKNEAEKVKTESCPHDATLAKMRSNLEDHIQKMDDLKKSRVELDGALKIAELTAQVFSPAGVRAHILDEVTPFLNDQTAKYLGTLSDGNLNAVWSTLVKTAKGELREKFSIEVTNEYGADSFKGVSGGEKRKVRVAAALALQDLVARRASKQIELWIGDEIDDALDAAGLERLMMVLEEKARSRGSVFVISHSDLRDWISEVVTVTKQNGMATIS